MMKAFKDNSARFGDNSDEDTIELELRPEHVRALSLAGESSKQRVERAPPPRRSHIPPAPRQTAHATDVWVSLTVAAVLGITALVVALWPSDESAKTPAAAQAVVPATASTLDTFSGSTTHTMLSEAQPSPMRFTNPFDASEVFEFPAGTTEDSARQSVAEVLLERARERRTQLHTVKHLQAHHSSFFSS